MYNGTISGSFKKVLDWLKPSGWPQSFVLLSAILA